MADNTIKIEYDELLELLAAFESSMQAYYSGLEKLTDKPELQKLWSMMAEQEETHARLVRLMRKRLRSDPDLRHSEFEVMSRNIKAVKDFIARYKTVIDTPDLDEKESFRLALDMEALEVDPIYRHFIDRQDKPTQDVFDELLESEDVHLNILVNAVKKHTSDPELHDYAEEILEKEREADA